MIYGFNLDQDGVKTPFALSSRPEDSNKMAFEDLPGAALFVSRLLGSIALFLKVSKSQAMLIGSTSGFMTFKFPPKTEVTYLKISPLVDDETEVAA